MIIVYFIIIAVVASIVIALYQNRKSQIEKIESCRKHYPYWFKQEIGMVGIVSSLSSFRLNSICKTIEKNNLTIEAENRRLMEKSIEQQYASTWRERESIEMNADIMKNMEELVNKAKIERFQKWYNRQNEFTRNSKNLHVKALGIKYHTINVDGVDEKGEKITVPFKVCQQSLNVVSSEVMNLMYKAAKGENDGVDYPHEYPFIVNSIEHGSSKMLTMVQSQREEELNMNTMIQHDYEKVLNFVFNIATEQTFVLFADIIPEAPEDYRERVYSSIKNKLNEKRIPYYNKEQQLPSGDEYNVIVIELHTTEESLSSVCDFLYSQYPFTQYAITYVSFFDDLTLSSVLKIIEEQSQKDKTALSVLLNKGTLLLPSSDWRKTGIVRWYCLSEQIDNGCLIFTSSKNGVEAWKSAITEMGLNEHSFQVEQYADYNYAEPYNDLLVFDNANALKTGTRAKLCSNIFARYVLTLGSVSGEDEELFQKARKNSLLKEVISTSYPHLNWGYVPHSYVRHSYFVRYYPQTLKDFEATEDEWNDRRFIWNFENNSNQAFDTAIGLLEKRLKETFEDLLPELTLVCLPALLSAKNEAAYKIFSERLCETTGMSNADTHYYSVVKDDDSMLGENGIDTVFDWDYFRGRNILLFDVLLSTGESLRNYSELMDSHGAEVIACITLGKSFHQREEEEVFSFE